jgi:hypothetical protein
MREENFILYKSLTLLMEPEQDPRENIGKPYRRGMLPYGGGVGKGGLISFVVTKKEHEELMQRIHSIT